MSWYFSMDNNKDKDPKYQKYNIIKNLATIAEIFEHSDNNAAAYKNANSLLRRYKLGGESEINFIYNDFRLHIYRGSYGKDSLGKRTDKHLALEIVNNTNGIECWTHDTAYGTYADMDDVSVNKYCANKVQYLSRLLKQM